MRITFIILLAGLLFLGCENNNNYKGITGVWIVEEQGDVTPYQRYNVSIRSDQYIDNLYIISNLHRIGEQYDTNLLLNDLQVEMSTQFVGNYTFSGGAGVLDPDFKKMTFTYHVQSNQKGINEEVRSTFKRE
ncbi:MAG: hypothetical protein PHU27_06760 [Salinivirgaceae bacterium]|nr:hypothetical protein [Salinivirgaceae bacterium]MDD4745728.1 hypothetical protein [Salinivirgaceae bacterium]MDY0279269.1 hypothetical protein [Salinivirgaceae bacterium]